jgi:hypothetical protein
MKVDLKQFLSIQQVDAYKENGCNIRASAGKSLYRIDYWDALKNLPNHGRFGAMTTFDGTEAAQQLMKESYPDAVVRLGIPCVVFEA